MFFQKKKDPFLRGCISRVGEYLKSRTGGTSLLLLTDRGSNRCHGDSIREVLSRAGYQVTYRIAEGDVTSLLGGEYDILFAFGGGRLWEQCEIAMATYPERHFAVMPTTFSGGMRIPGRGCVLPDSFFYDEAVTETQPESCRLGGIVSSVRLGMTLDRKSFDMVYSSFPEGELVRRSVTIWHDICVAEKAGSRAREYLAFGSALAGKVLAMMGEEITPWEALSVGMRMEGTVAVRFGVAKEKYLHDLIGVLLFYGLPTAIHASPGEWETVLCEAGAPSQTVSLMLPVKKGECVRYALTVGELLSIINREEM